MHFAYYQHLGRHIDIMPLANKIFLTCIDVLQYCFVDLFVVLSGYLLCCKKTNYGKICRLWILCLFTSLGIMSIMSVCFPESISISGIVRSVFPILTCSYWYITVYMILYVMSPAFNKIIRNADVGKFRKYLVFFTIVLTIVMGANPLVPDSIFIGSSQSIIWFCYLYFVGAYLKFSNSNRTWLYICGAVVSFLTMFIIQWTRLPLPEHMNIMNGSGILPLVFTVCLFRTVIPISPRKNIKILSYISQSSLLVYLIQETPQFRQVFWPSLNLQDYIGSPVLILIWSGVILFLFAIACIANYVFNRLYSSVFHKFTDRFTGIFSNE